MYNSRDIGEIGMKNKLVHSKISVLFNWEWYGTIIVIVKPYTKNIYKSVLLSFCCSIFPPVLLHSFKFLTHTLYAAIFNDVIFKLI